MVGADMFDKALRDPACRKVIATNSELPRSTLALLASDPDDGVASEAKRCIELDVDRGGARRRSRDDEAMLRALVAADDRLGLTRLAETSRHAPTLSELARSGHSQVRYHAAKNAYTPPAALRRLLIDEESGVCYVAATNPNMPSDIVAAHATSTEESQRANAARSTASDAATLTLLSGDTSDHVRQMVAENPRMPVAVAGSLLSDPSEIVRYAAASHEAAAGLLADHLTAERLACGDAVAIGAATNPACPRAVIDTLTAHDSPRVAKAILNNPASTLGARDEVLRRFCGETFICATVGGAGLGRRCDVPTLSPGTLQFLGFDADDTQRRVIAAAHPAVSAPLISRLAVDKDRAVREAAAENPMCPKRVLSDLAESESSDIRSRVAANANCPTDALRALARDRNDDVRLYAAGNSNMPADALPALFADIEEVRLMALTFSPHVTLITPEMLRGAVETSPAPSL